MKDTLIAMYEQNEQYHTTKETMFWLCTTLYFGFSAYAVSWILSVNLRNTDFMYVIGVALILVAIFAAKFSIRQNWLKCLSVIKSESYTKLLIGALDDDSIRRGLQELASEIEKVEKRHHRENRAIWREKGKPGLWIMPIFWLFFSIQMLAILDRLKWL